MDVYICVHTYIHIKCIYTAADIQSEILPKCQRGVYSINKILNFEILICIL